MKNPIRLYIQFYLIVGSILMIGCEEERNDSAIIAGVLFDIGNNLPMHDTWIVLQTGTGISLLDESLFENEFIDSIKTDKSGRFKFDHINLNHSVYKLTPHKKDYLIAESSLFPPFAHPINSKAIFDTLQMGVKTGIRISLIHEDIHDGKDASIAILFRTTALGIHRSESIIFVDNSVPHEIHRDYLYDFNKTIEIAIHVFDGVTQTNNSSTFNLTPRGIENIEFRY